MSLRRRAAPAFGNVRGLARNHADEVVGRCYVDVFFCKAFGPELAAGIALRWFGGRSKLAVLHS